MFAAIILAFSAANKGSVDEMPASLNMNVHMPGCSDPWGTCPYHSYYMFTSRNTVAIQSVELLFWEAISSRRLLILPTTSFGITPGALSASLEQDGKILFVEKNTAKLVLS